MGASGKVSRTSVGRTLSSLDRAKYCPTLDEYSHDLDTMGRLKKTVQRVSGKAEGRHGKKKHRAKGRQQGRRATWKHRAKGRPQGRRAFVSLTPLCRTQGPE